MSNHLNNAIYEAKLEKIKYLKENIMVQDELLRKKCDLLLQALVGDKLINEWWEGHNKAFNMTPNEQWKNDPRVVFDYLCGYAFR